MIDKNEIRLGVWIKYADNPEFTPEYRNKPVQVDEDIMVKLFSKEKEYKFYNPIPLSEEVLVKCGFMEDDDTSFWNNNDKTFYTLNKEWHTFPIARDINGKFYKYYPADDDYYSTIGNELLYLHELMNLYHSLTKEELVYKP